MAHTHVLRQVIAHGTYIGKHTNSYVIVSSYEAKRIYRVVQLTEARNTDAVYIYHLAMFYTAI
jgi:hypothetical protein